MNNIIELSASEKNTFETLSEKFKVFAQKYKIELGVLEMAVGAGAICYGVNTGAISIGRDMVATLINGDSKIAQLLGLGTFGAAGALIASCIGGIGVAAGGTAIGIPAAVVCGGATLVFGAFGYKAGDIISELMKDSIPIIGTSALVIGTALMLDGAMRLIPDEIKSKLNMAISQFKSGIIFLVESTGKVVAQSLDVLSDLYSKVFEKLKGYSKNVPLQYIGATTGASIIGVGGVALGTSVATSMVTVGGSSMLGSVALSLGLVSAPIWPVIAIGTVSAVVGTGVFIGLKKILSPKNNSDFILEDLLLLTSPKNV